MKIVISIGILGVLIFSGCSTMKVEKVDKKYDLKYVCIENNPKVIVNDFIPVVEEVFNQYGIATDIYEKSAMPDYCTVKMTYTALRKWDMAPYLVEAYVRLFKNGKKIGDAKYSMTGGGGLDLSKWASVKSKMTPVLENLLSQYDKKDVIFDKSTLRNQIKASSNESDLTIEEKIIKIQNMKDSGLITENEYSAKRQQLLNDY